LRLFSQAVDEVATSFGPVGGDGPGRIEQTAGDVVGG
jgi:hypothetical protein